MANKAPKQTSQKTVATLTHEEARRKTIPTAEYQSVMQKEAESPVRVVYELRNRDLDPQLAWRGKDEQDWSDLVVHAPLLYIQEKVHPKVLIDDLLKQARISRQKEIDASIAAKAEFEYLYDKPYDDKKRVRVAGPFTVESLSPHRVLGVDEHDELIDGIAASTDGYGGERGFVQIILENIKIAGVQQAHKEDRITFTSLTPWPGDRVCAEGRYIEGSSLEPSPPGGGRG